jgi:two-component system, OmpR family, response regulator
MSPERDLQRGSEKGLVLVVEDEEAIVSVLRMYLTREGFTVHAVGDGVSALTAVRRLKPTAVILDIGLPGLDGFEVCRRLRDDGVFSPILMLTARDGVPDRVAGLDAGADDYLVKPFSYAELLARLRALARRGNGQRSPELRVGDLRLDPAKRQVWRGDDEIELSAKEFAVLEVFMRRPGEVLSRFQLLEHAWDYEYENRSNIVDSYVRLLRRKVDKPFGVESIQTVRGAGYRLREDGGA